MKNFINCRLSQTKSGSEIHNFRFTDLMNEVKKLNELKKEGKLNEKGLMKFNQKYNELKNTKTYTLKNMNVDNFLKNSNYYIDENGTAIKIDINNSNNLIKKNVENNKKYSNEYKKLYYERRKKKEKWKKESGLIEGVFTFSEKIDKDLGGIYSIEKLSRIAKDAQIEIAKELGTKPIGDMVLHLDESRPHFHFYLKNFDDSKDGQQILYKNRKTEQLSKIQDIAFKHFKKLGMERGIKKENTGRMYQTTKEYHEKQIKQKQETLTNLNKYSENFEKLFELKTIEEIKIFRDKFIKEKNNEKNNLPKEVATLNNKIVRMTGNMIKYGNIEKYLSEINQKKDSLSEINKNYFNNFLSNTSSFAGLVKSETVEKEFRKYNNKIVLNEIALLEKNKTKEEELNEREKVIKYSENDLKSFKNFRLKNKELEKEKEKLLEDKESISIYKDNLKNEVDNYKERSLIIDNIHDIDPREVFDFDKVKEKNDFSFTCNSPFRDDGENRGMAWEHYGDKWRFVDFGTDMKGDLIDFKKELNGKTFNEVINDFQKNNLDKFIEISEKPKKEKNVIDKEIPNFETSEIYFNPLKKYLKEREIYKIPGALKQYKVETKNNSFYYALGIKNESDGVVLRNNMIKGNIGNSNISHINNNSSNLVVCEGMFDYLSLYQNNGDSVDYVVLNTTSNVDKLLKSEIMKDYKNTSIILDNDDAGKKATDKIKENNNNVFVIDLDKRFNDISDLYMNKLSIDIDKET